MKVILSSQEIRRAIADYIVGNLATAGQDISVDLMFPEDADPIIDDMGLIAVVEMTPNRSLPQRSLTPPNMALLAGAIPNAVRVTPKPIMLVNADAAAKEAVSEKPTGENPSVAAEASGDDTQPVRRRGRPPGSKNRTKEEIEAAGETSNAAEVPEASEPGSNEEAESATATAETVEEVTEPAVEPGVNSFQARLREQNEQAAETAPDAEEAEAPKTRLSIFGQRPAKAIIATTDDDASDPVSDRLASPEQMAKAAADEEAEAAIAETQPVEPSEPKPTKSLFANLKSVGQNRNS